MSAKKVKEPEQEKPEDVASDLHERIWSVVSFEGVIGENLTYEEARDRLASLEEKRTPGLCIVTNATAERMNREKVLAGE